MQYSPKLKEAMVEVLAILQKHDIAGVVVLHTPGFSEYLFKIDPSYSCAKFDNKTGALRFRAKLYEDFNGNKEKHIQVKSDTANMLSHMAELTLNLALNLNKVSHDFDAVVGADHGKGNHTSHNQQNN